MSVHVCVHTSSHTCVSACAPKHMCVCQHAWMRVSTPKYAQVCAKRAQVRGVCVCKRVQACAALAGRAGVVEVQRSVTAVLGQDVVLPCRYRAQEQEHVVQVTWLKRGPAGSSAEVAVLNREHGEHVQEPYAGRVMRRAGGPLEDGAIVLRNAVQGDEGDYECHLITFPMGSFEGRLTLKVLGECTGHGP